MLDCGQMYARYDELKANGKCAICARPAITGANAERKAHEFMCAVCGAYRVTEEFIWELPAESSPLHQFLYRISSSFRITSERIADIRDLPVHQPREIIAILNTPDPPVDEKLGILLSSIARDSGGPGRFMTFDCKHDYPLVSASGEGEAEFLFDSLYGEGLLQGPDYQPTDSATYLCRVTVAGWSELSRRERAGADSANAFIAMSFAPELAAFGEAISGALAATGYTPIRMDRIEHLNRIDDEILARLRSSKFLVADLTSQNPGAYFEAGFMLGLGRPVVWVCSKEQMTQIHFDTRQYNIIDYDDRDDLQKRLKNRIEATIGLASAK